MMNKRIRKKMMKREGLTQDKLLNEFLEEYKNIRFKRFIQIEKAKSLYRDKHDINNEHEFIRMIVDIECGQCTEINELYDEFTKKGLCIDTLRNMTKQIEESTRKTS